MRDDSAASPVIGVLLMVGVVMILFGIAASMIRDISTSTNDLHYHAGPGEPFPVATHESNGGGVPEDEPCRVPIMHGLRCVVEAGKAVVGGPAP